MMFVDNFDVDRMDQFHNLSKFEEEMCELKNLFVDNDQFVLMVDYDNY
jgi:hypothetical protein